MNKGIEIVIENYNDNTERCIFIGKIDFDDEMHGYNEITTLYGKIIPKYSALIDRFDISITNIDEDNLTILRSLRNTLTRVNIINQNNVIISYKLILGKNFKPVKAYDEDGTPFYSVNFEVV